LLLPYTIPSIEKDSRSTLIPSWAVIFTYCVRVEKVTINSASKANTFNHIFGKSEHALDGLVQKFGTREKTFNAVQKAANKALNSGSLTPNAKGILPSGNIGNIIKMGGTEVRLIGGRVQNGKVILSSFSRKGL